MSELFQSRFDEFQEDAVAAIVNDFRTNLFGRYLLVVPTGGGKTFTAVKAINRLFEKNILDSAKDQVLWVAHRGELLEQAKRAFDRYTVQYKERPSFKGNISFLMTSDVQEKLRSLTNKKLAVIDEAHHAAANSYRAIFDSQLGILGLTATPSRHDGRPLDFERESYSIGFPDLVERGIILKPEVRKIKSNSCDVGDLGDQGELEKLNNTVRNELIARTLIEGHEEYNKVVIYVGTIKHAKDLRAHLMRSPLKGLYNSIEYITGGENSRGVPRASFLEEQSRHNKSILINVDVLTEGYDDPSINTVMMARPTRSKLVYMQSMGRAIRRDPANELKRAFVVEIDEELPNIRYRIDNRWLYADISDALEPAVLDCEFNSPEDFKAKLIALYKEYAVRDEDRLIPEFDRNQRYSMLMFQVYKGHNTFFHFPILISNANRLKVSNMFNFLSERMNSYINKETNSEVVYRAIAGLGDIAGMDNKVNRDLVFEAMSNACTPVSTVGGSRYWVTFVAFMYRERVQDIPKEIIEFTDQMVNKNEIIELVRTKSYAPDSYLIRLPLPLASFFGLIVSSVEMVAISKVVDSLIQIKLMQGSKDHRAAVEDILNHTVVPIEHAHLNSLTLVAREDIKYSIGLN